MSFADSLKTSLYNARSIAGQLGLRPHTVAIVRGTWSGDHTGDGTETKVTTPITEAGGQPPKTHWLNEEQLAVAQLPKGTVEIGPITPSFSGGGTPLATLAGTALARGETLHIVITGPNHPAGATYRITDVSADSALHYTIRAQPTAEV